MAARKKKPKRKHRKCPAKCSVCHGSMRGKFAWRVHAHLVCSDCIWRVMSMVPSMPSEFEQFCANGFPLQEVGNAKQ